jgi:hypothetical protein
MTSLPLVPSRSLDSFCLDTLDSITIKNWIEEAQQDPVKVKKELLALRHRVRTEIYSPELRENIEQMKGEYRVSSVIMSEVFGVRHDNLINSLKAFVVAGNLKVSTLLPVSSVEPLCFGEYATERGNKYECVYFHLDQLNDYLTYLLSVKTQLSNLHKIRLWIATLTANKDRLRQLNKLLEPVEASLLNASEAAKGLTTRFPLRIGSGEEVCTKMVSVSKSSVHPLSVEINNCTAAILKADAQKSNALAKKYKWFSSLPDFSDCVTTQDLERREVEILNAVGGNDNALRLVDDINKAKRKGRSPKLL